MPSESVLHGPPATANGAAPSGASIAERMLRNLHGEGHRRGMDAKKAGYWRSDEALQSGIQKIAAFYKEHKRAPFRGKETDELGINGLIRAVMEGAFRKDKIYDYDDLLNRAGIDTGTHPERWGCGDGLRDGMLLLQEFNSKNGRAPNEHEARRQLGLGKLISYIENAFFEDIGLKSYPGFLVRAGLTLYRLQHLSWFWSTDEAFEYATDKIRSFHEKNNVSPSLRDLDGMKLRPFYDKLESGAFAGKGILSYNQLLESLGFEKVLSETDWAREQGLKEAVSRTISFYKEWERRPTEAEAKTELVLPAFIKHLSEGKFAAWYLRSFDGFLAYVDMLFWKTDGGLEEAGKRVREFNLFERRLPTIEEARSQLSLEPFILGLESGVFGAKGFSNFDSWIRWLNLPEISRSNFWNKIEGLDEAARRIRKFVRENKRLPTSVEMDKELRMNGMMHHLKLKTFEQQGVTDVLSLLRYAKVPIGLRTGYGFWATEEGFAEACRRIKEFYEQNRRSPRAAEAFNVLKLGGFMHSKPSRKFLEAKGIKTYLDLIEHLRLPKPERKEALWTSEKGLQIGIKKAKVFEKENGWTPTVQEFIGVLKMSSLLDQIYNWRFERLGITSYNTFLVYAGLQITQRTKGYWIGEQGLEEGSKKVLEFVKREGRHPTVAEFEGMELAKLRQYVSDGIFIDLGIVDTESFVAYAEENYAEAAA